MAKWKYRKKHFIAANHSLEKIEANGFRSYLLTKFVKRELIFMVIAVLFATSTMLGGSYAVLSNIQKAEKYNVIKTGTLQIAYDDTSEGLGNIIKLNGAYPESDEVGQGREPYRFKITNTGSLNTDYKVKILDDTSMIEEDGCQDKLLDKSKIKYSIDQKEAAILSTTAEEYNIISGTLASGESVTYSIRIWIDELAGNEVLGTHYHGKIVVEAVQKNEEESIGRASDIIFNAENIGDKGAIDTSDEEQTFITGEDPNNYVWYSGKLWRAVAKDTMDNSVKLVTQWGISAMNYGARSNDVIFGTSYTKEWLNDTSVDGFLGNLKEPEKFIKMDSGWNATMMEDTTKPTKITMVNAAVGLLNVYEYTMSYNGTTAQNGYLNNSLSWSTITPLNVTWIRSVMVDGSLSIMQKNNFYPVRPCINLKPNIGIFSGTGTIDDPYRLNGDHDSPATGVLLNTRYSGEYISFGTGENNLYRIVSHEFGGTKLVSDEPLKNENKVYIQKKFSNVDEEKFYNPLDENYPIAYFLNHDFLDPVNGFLTSEQVNMIEDSTWYIGSIDFSSHYRLAKYKSEESNEVIESTVQAKVGLLRLGEQFAGLQQKRSLSKDNWLLTRSDVFLYYIVANAGTAHHISPRDTQGFRPSVHLKSTIKITGGEGTKQNPFTISQ